MNESETNDVKSETFGFLVPDTFVKDITLHMLFVLGCMNAALVQ